MENTYHSKNHKAEVQTLVYLVKGENVLLIEKKRGLGKGFFNGAGGKVHEGENVEECAKRECEEELRVIPKKLEWRALLRFVNYVENKVSEEIYVHVFLCEEWEGEPEETEEAKPFWFSISQLPWNKMWEDDVFWLPHVLKGKRVYAEFAFQNWKLLHGRVYFLEESKNQNISNKGS